MNVALTSNGELAEVQISGERSTISRAQFDDMLTLAESGCRSLFEFQNQALGDDA